jgi:hypothetical protein
MKMAAQTALFHVKTSTPSFGFTGTSEKTQFRRFMENPALPAMA